jgi:hypothetical protein
MSKRALLAALILGLSAPAIAAPSLDARIDALASEIDRLEGDRAVKKLQRAFGYYMDRGLWDEAADLFADSGSVEIGQDGVYVGRPRIKEYLQRLGGGQPGLIYGQLNEWLQLQPVVHVAPDGLSAKARWRDLAMLGQFQRSAAWRDGVYENEYVKEGGVWKIAKLHLFVTFLAPYDKGWARLTSVEGDWKSDVAKAFPPDRPPTAAYKPFPDTQLAPFHYPNPVTGKRTKWEDLGGLDAKRESLEGQYSQLRQRASLLNDLNEIENLQAAYGYYFDKGLWGDISQLFTATGTFEYGQRGVYVGSKRIAQALTLIGPQGGGKGWLNEHMQLQPIITVAPDGRTAKARWRSVVQLARPNENGQWGEGTYENEYVKETGVWKLAKLHFYVTGFTDYDLGWMKSVIPTEGPSRVLPPDRPPTEIYRALPGVYIPAYDYMHPVTGKPIPVKQPADTVLGRK